MVDVTRLRRKTLSTPPSLNEAPELPRDNAPPRPLYQPRPRRSIRTLQLGLKVSPEFDQRLRQIAARDGLLMVEVLERALDSYEDGQTDG